MRCVAAHLAWVVLKTSQTTIPRVIFLVREIEVGDKTCFTTQQCNPNHEI